MEPLTVLSEFDQDEPTLNIIHFNDVYNIEQSTDPDQLGGAPLFVALLDHLREKHKGSITIFSGDILSPSSMSTMCMGQQMIDLMKYFRIDYACIGNHDFDFGMDQLKKLLEAPDTNTSWFLSNLFDYETKEPLPLVHVSEIVAHQGVKIGLMGLIENEWIDTLGTVDRDELLYEDFIQKGRELAVEMRKKGAEFVIAITHMRIHNDNRLLNQVEEIDLILGGHDHDDGIEKSKGRLLVKSGTDFRETSLIQILIGDQGPKFNVHRYFTDGSIPPNKEVELLVEEYMNAIEEKLNETIGTLNVDLDGRFSTVRLKESNLGNFVCDCVMRELDIDCVLLNSGSLRSDRFHKSGEFKLRDIKQILPSPDQMVVVKCPGTKLKEALENSVSKWPSLEGRFLQVAGVKFKFDPRRPSGQRVLPASIMINDSEIDLNEDYVVSVKEYMYKGRDGYEMLSDCELLVDEENGPCLPNTIINYFNALKQWKESQWNKRHRLSVISLQLSKGVLLNLHEIEIKAKPKLSFKTVSTAFTQALKLHGHVSRTRSRSKSLAALDIADQASRYRINKTDFSYGSSDDKKIRCFKAIT
ncbi:hypothetical protein ACOME3_004096 [Neoechinorhynchus agilis]